MSRAREAARLLFDAPRAERYYEPVGVVECEAAVDELAACFAAGGGTLREMVDNARAGAQALSSDRLQGISEVLQNADDAGATSVVVTFAQRVITAVHDGRPATLRDIHALAAPWLTTKADDESATGRFGIGLSTLHSIAESFEFHSGDYHVQLGAPTVAVVADTPPDHSGTLLRVPLRDGALLEPGGLLAWADEWDHASLLFLRHIRTVVFSDHSVERKLHLRVRSSDRVLRHIGGREVKVRRSVVVAPDARSWTVERAELPSPAGVRRAHKSTGPTTLVAVALPHQGGERGRVYARLPVADIGVPAFLNGEFDPTTGRQALSNTAWNRAIAELVVELWTSALIDQFMSKPTSAWHAVPLDEGSAANTGTDAVDELERSIARQSTAQVAREVRLPVGDHLVALADLAYEDEVLAELLTEDEVAELAGVEHCLTGSLRDPGGRWREVLRVWRAAEVPTPRQVDIATALPLAASFSDAGRSTALVIAAIESNLHEALRTVGWVRLASGSRIAPPAPRGLPVLTSAADSLATSIGFGAQVAYDMGDAAPVLGWLEEHSTLERGMPVGRILERLSAAGGSGTLSPVRLTDDELKRLRAAMEELPRSERQRLGPGIGRAVLLDAFGYAEDGSRQPRRVRPDQAYIPAQIDKDPDSFAVAARSAPGPCWLSPKYQDVLRSPIGREGFGARAMLVTLGASTAPRFVEHPARQFKYGARKGLLRHTPGSPGPRTRALLDLGAEASLEDLRSEDLEAVALDIAADRDDALRRRRARAMLASLVQAWPTIGEHAKVAAANGYYAWTSVGEAPSWWLAHLQDTPWLDDDTGRPRRPTELRQPTPSNLAAYGDEAGVFLHPDLWSERNGEVLSSLGVAGEPTTPDLLDRLRTLRAGGSTEESVHRQATGIYRALASRLPMSLAHRARGSDPGLHSIRAAFGRDELVLTTAGWFPPAHVFRGPPVFGAFRPHVPPVPGAEALWGALLVPEPRASDCLAVLRLLARTPRQGPDLEAVHLDVLRLLMNLLPSASSREIEALRRCPVRTSRGWVRDRPLYAVVDPMVAAGLGDKVPVWDPGGEVSQFRTLCRPLRIVEVADAQVTAASKDGAVEDEDATRLLHAAVEHLRDDLARNDPDRHADIAVSWDDLSELVAVIAPALAVSVDLGGKAFEVQVPARAELSSHAFYLRDPEELRRAEGAGRAVASLFSADRRSVAYAWLAAVQAAEEQRDVAAVRTAHEVAREDRWRAEQEGQDALSELQADTRKRREGGRGVSRVGGPGGAHRPPGDAGAPDARPRVLVDAARLVLRNEDGAIVRAVPREPRVESPSRGAPALKSPAPNGATPQQHASYRAYTDLDKEELAVDLLRWVLQGDDQRIVDLRAQRGVGADAVDTLERFFELKAYAGGEPESVRLEPSEVLRALDAGKEFFLVVVSGLEGSAAKPKVRIIDHPLDRLTLTERTAVEYKGISSAGGLVFDFDQAEGSPA